MKRVPWILIVVAAVLIGAVLFLREKPVRPDTGAADAASTTATVPGSFTPAAVNVSVPLPKPNLVEIQDGKTIDFSSGLPVIKDSDKDQAVLERALKQMEEAAAGVSFGTPQEPAKK